MPDSTARKYFLLCFDNNLSDEKERTQAEFIVQKIFETHVCIVYLFVVAWSEDKHRP